jgi:hypothetical protein
MTYAEHEKKLKAPAVCELVPLRDLPGGDNVMVRTNGAFVAGYELRGILAYFATDGDRNQTKLMLNATPGSSVARPPVIQRGPIDQKTREFFNLSLMMG